MVSRLICGVNILLVVFWFVPFGFKDLLYISKNDLFNIIIIYNLIGYRVRAKLKG